MSELFVLLLGRTPPLETRNFPPQSILEAKRKTNHGTNETQALTPLHGALHTRRHNLSCRKNTGTVPVMGIPLVA